MCSLAEQVLEFFCCDNDSDLAIFSGFAPYFIRRMTRHYADQRDGRLWAAALNTECKLVRVSNLNAYELIAERGPSDGVSLTDAAGNHIKYPKLPVVIVEVVKRHYTYEKYTLLEQLY